MMEHVFGLMYSGPGSVTAWHPLLHLAEFRLEDGNDLGDRLASDGVTPPASLDHPPHMIRKLSVVRPTRPTSLQHQMNPCNLALVGERNSTGKQLAQFRLRINPEKLACPPLTSQARTPNAYISLAIVAPLLVNRKRCGLTSSGATP